MYKKELVCIIDFILLEVQARSADRLGIVLFTVLMSD